MTTVPGFSSRTTTSTVKQLPMRDEALMIDNHEPGWSNSAPDSPERVSATDVPDAAEADAKVVEPAASESKTVKKAAPRKSAK